MAQFSAPLKEPTCFHALGLVLVFDGLADDQLVPEILYLGATSLQSPLGMLQLPRKFELLSGLFVDSLLLVFHFCKGSLEVGLNTLALRFSVLLFDLSLDLLPLVSGFLSASVSQQLVSLLELLPVVKDVPLILVLFEKAMLVVREVLARIF